MKKVGLTLVSIVLFSCLLFPQLSFAFAQPDSTLSVFVASDIHYRPESSLGPIGQQNNLPGDPLYYHANTKGMLSYEADAIIDEFLSRFEASDAEYLLIPGDISEDGFWDEHLGIAQKLRDFKERTGKKIFLIPGNHDIRTSDSKGRLNLSDFLDVYSDIGYDETLARHSGTASYTAELGNDYRLIAIDACIYRQDGSTVSPELLTWIQEQVAEANRDEKKLIGMVHHSVLKHFGIESIGGNLLCLDNYQTLATSFADWGIKYFFTGHEHANDISSAVSKNGNRIFDIETCSLITYPNAYRKVSFSDEGVTVRTEYIDKINTDLLPDGYNEAQINLIKSDFPAYSYNYFRAGFKSYAYEIPDATENLAGDLEIEAGTTAYRVLSQVMLTLRDAVRLPMYDVNATPQTDSVAEIAKKAGITLEESEYDSVLDVAAVIYAGHYAGDENLPFDSTEVRLLGQSLNAVLIYALMNVPVDTANLLLTEIGLPANIFTVSNSVYTLAAKTAYMKRASKAIMLEYFKPIANGIISDESVPSDLNETLEPYGETGSLPGQSTEISVVASVLNIILTLFRSTLNIFKLL